MKSQQSSAMPFRNSTSQEIEMAQLPNSNSYSSTNSNKIKKNSTNKTNSKHTATKSNLKAELNHLDATIASIKNQFEEYHKTDCESIRQQYHTSFCYRETKFFYAILAGTILEVCYLVYYLSLLG